MADRVTFTRSSAERIAHVVRIVEAGNRDSGALPVSPRQDTPLRLKVGTFTGAWATGAYKTVTYENTTNTASVYNWCVDVAVTDTADTSETRYVIFGNVQGTSSALEVQQQTPDACAMRLGGLDLTSLDGYALDEVQLLGHNESACLQWYSITTCATATA